MIRSEVESVVILRSLVRILREPSEKVERSVKNLREQNWSWNNFYFFFFEESQGNLFRFVEYSVKNRPLIAKKSWTNRKKIFWKSASESDTDLANRCRIVPGIHTRSVSDPVRFKLWRKKILMLSDTDLRPIGWKFL